MTQSEFNNLSIGDAIKGYFDQGIWRVTNCYFRLRHGEYEWFVEITPVDKRAIRRASCLARPIICSWPALQNYDRVH